MGKDTAVQEQVKSRHFETVRSWWDKPFASGSQRAWLLGIVLGALVFRVWQAAASGYGCKPDTFLFLTQAHDLADGHWARWFYINTKPPVYSFLLAAGIKAGLNEMVFAKFVSILMGVVFLHPAWLILGRLSEGRTRVLGLATAAFCLLAVEVSATATADITYAVILLYSLYFALYRGLLDGKTGGFAVGGVLLGVAFLTRSEAIIYLPLMTMFAVWGAVRKRCGWKTAGKSLVYPALAVIVLAPQVALLCRYEGRFLLRRNAGNLIEESITKAQAGPASAADAVSTRGENVASRPGQLAAAAYRMAVTVAVNSFDYVTDKIPEALGYVPALFLVVGLITRREKLFRFSPESITLLTFVWTFVVLSLIESHTRFLIGVIPMIAAPVAGGIIILAAKVLENKPAEFGDEKLVKSSTYFVMAFFVLGVTVPTAARIATRNPYEGSEIVAAGEFFAEMARNEPGERSKAILTDVRESTRLEYITGMPTVLLDRKKKYDVREIEDILAGHPDTAFLVLEERSVRYVFPDFPAVPEWAEHLETCQTHPRSKEPERVYIFRIVREELAGESTG